MQDDHLCYHSHRQGAIMHHSYPVLAEERGKRRGGGVGCL